MTEPGLSPPNRCGCRWWAVVITVRGAYEQNRETKRVARAESTELVFGEYPEFLVAPVLQGLAQRPDLTRVEIREMEPPK